MIDGLSVHCGRFVRRNGKTYPEYTVVDSRTGNIFAMHSLLSGGRLADDPVVALYTCGAHQVVLKALAEPDQTNERDLVKLTAGLTCMVPAHVVFVGRERDEFIVWRYTVIAMEFSGYPVHAEVPMAPEKALEIVAWVCDACIALAERDLYYVDLKPNNVLQGPNGLLLCDYGAITHVSEGAVACSTYPPANYPRGSFIPPNESSVAYGLGALLACLCSASACENLRFVDAEKTPFLNEATAVLLESQTEVRENSAEHVGRVLDAAWAPNATLRAVRAALSSSCGGAGV
jgi:hypothetical protein